MNNTDFIRLNGLLSKLESALHRAEYEDGSFKKYYHNSVEAIKESQNHLRKLEEGLRTAKIFKELV